MLISTLISALLLAAPVQASVPQAQEPSSVPATDLEDIVVEGRRLEEVTQDFVREVGAPAGGRGLARWRNGVCVGVANLQNDAAQYIADRVSTVAQDLGLRVGDPGCEPSILIVATQDANAFTPQFVASRPRLFIVGGTGMDRGRNALQRFETNDQPVRWWNVSVPVDGDTGQIAVRLPGSVNGGADNGDANSVMLFAPNIDVRAASRLSTQIVDDTKRTFVIVDVTKISAISLAQLADYIALVSMAQVDPEADTSGYATILNVFDDPTQTEGLTNWDKAYLHGLYDATRTRKSQGASRTEIVASIIGAHHDLARAASQDSAQ